MKHFLFEIIGGEDEGEEFIVSADTLEAAQVVATEVADGARARFCCELTEEEAENSGLDEY